MTLQGSEKADFGALHAPIAPFTWAFTTELPGTVRRGPVVPLRFTRPLEILGIKASVIAKLPLGEDLTVPTIDDVDVLLQTDNEDMWTATLSENGPEDDFVPLPHLTVDAPRLLRIVPKGDAPDLGFQFQWVQFVSESEPIFNDAIIRVSLFVRRLSKEQRDDYLKTCIQR